VDSNFKYRSGSPLSTEGLMPASLFTSENTIVLLLGDAESGLSGSRFERTDTADTVLVSNAGP
jgi:hypothetical protein